MGSPEPSAKRLRNFVALIVTIAILSVVASIYGVPTKFHLWEIPIDGRILAIACTPILLYPIPSLTYQLSKFGTLKWRWKSNLAAFLVPIAFLGFIILIPQVWGKNVWDDLGNSPTTMFGALLDIPALYVFSFAVVLFDEIVFRGFLLDAIRQRQGLIPSMSITTLIWVVASAEKFINAEDHSLESLATGLLYLLSVGFACSAIFCHTNSVWNCYSYRIGIQVVSSAIIGSGLAVDPEFLSPPLAPLYVALLLIFFNITITIFFAKRAKPIEIRA